MVAKANVLAAAYKKMAQPSRLVCEVCGSYSVRVERGRQRARDAIDSERVRARSPWPWCDGAYYMQYRIDHAAYCIPPPAGEAYEH